MNLLLSVQNLEVCYGAISALQDVSLDIRCGEIVTLIGSNGAGKTTLLRTISGLLRPTNGSITFGADATSAAGVPARDPGAIEYQTVIPSNLIDECNRDAIVARDRGQHFAAQFPLVCPKR